MPLPSDSTFSLLPHTNPGESEHTQPKQALIIRLSEEVLEALQSYGADKPQVDFDFGKSPGISIGGTFYPMNGSEEINHELYLRASSAKQQSPPLKHYANVTHKYSIGFGGRDEAKAADRIRERVNDAAKQKEEHKTVFLDTPPSLTPSSSTSNAPSKKKRKDPTSAMFRNAVKNTDRATAHRAAAPTVAGSSTPTSAVVTRVASPAPPRKRDDLQDHPRRKALIHCLAVNSEKAREQLTRMILGSSASSSSAQQDFHDLLEDVAEPSAPLRKGEDPGKQPWRLKTESWTEVRPFDWPKWGESDRIAVARTGRQKLHALGIKSTDAVWKHFEPPRQNNNSTMASTPSSSSSNTAPAVEPKRGVSSTEMKEKEKERKKSRADPKEITMRDEGARVRAASAVKASSAATNSKLRDESPHPQGPPPIRTGAGGKKLPGSGYKASSLASPAASPSPTTASPPTKASDPRPRPPKETASSSLPPKPKPKPKASPVAASSSAKPERNPVTGLPNKRIGKTKDVPTSGVDSDRERASDRAESGKSRSALEKGKRVDSKDGSSSLKRKQAAEEDGDYEEGARARALAAKKRKVEGGATPVSTPPTLKEGKGRDLGLNRRPELTPGMKPKTKQEPSPLPPLPHSPKVKREREQSPAVRAAASRDRERKPTPQPPVHRRSESVKTNGSGKSRRKSPIYTSSSEDEGEIPSRNATAAKAANSLPTPSPNGDHGPPGHRHAKQEKQESTFATMDHATLRLTYKETYSQYHDLYGFLRDQRLKIEKQMSRGSAGSESGDDILSNDELVAKSHKYNQLFKDLKEMREIMKV